MGPRKFFQDVAIPNIEELRAADHDIRKAFNAVAAIDSLAAHLFVWCKANAPTEIVGLADDTQYRARLAASNPDFSLIRDIAKAQKHVHLSRGSPQITTAEQISTRSLGWGQARWGEGRWGGGPQVVVETDAGELRVVCALVQNAAELLKQEMDRLDVP